MESRGWQLGSEDTSTGLPADKVKHALLQFEDELLWDYPEIYHANRNKAGEAAAGKPVWAVRAAVWALSKMNRSF